MGTDYPVVELNPFPNIYAAVTRCNYDGTPAGVSNGEYMTMAEALSGYTLGSAKAYNMDKFIGTLEVEKYADIIVVDRNLFKIDPAEILDAKVVLTMSAGRITYKV